MNARATFTNFPKDKPKKSIHLFNVISSGNNSQCGDFFDGFVSLVNLQQESIARVTIIDGTDLARHYKNDKKSLVGPGESVWQETHKDKCNSFAVPFDLISWGALLERKNYKEHEQNIKRDYRGGDGQGPDCKFQKIVDEVAARHLQKGNKEDVINFLLEECAGALTLEDLALELESKAKVPGRIQEESQIKERHIAYPGGLNEAIQYALRKYKSNLKQQNYRLKSRLNNFGLFEKGIVNQVQGLDLKTEAQRREFNLRFSEFCDSFRNGDHNNTSGNLNEPQVNRTTISSSAC